MSSRLLVIVIVLIVIVSSGFLFLFLSQPQEEPQDNHINLTPELTILSPSPGSKLSGTVTINISIVDEEDLVANVYIDGSLIATANTYEWNTTLLPDGKHTIRADAIDSEGKRDRQAIEVNIDNGMNRSYQFDGDINIMVYNIKESGVNSGWKDVVKAVNPDLVVFVETGTWDDNANEKLNRYVSEFNSYFANEALYVGYCTKYVDYSTSGEAIVSRLPIKQFNQIANVRLDDNSTYKVTHDFLEAIVDFNGTDVHVFGGHLKASDGQQNQYRREREMEGLINYMDDLGNVPIIYLSDQNSYSPYDNGTLAPQSDMDLGYGPMTMLLDPSDETYGHYSSKVHNFTDVYRTLNPDDPGFTYGHQTTTDAFRIDYIIVNSFFDSMLINSSVYTAPPAQTASDHYAVNAWFHWNMTSQTYEELTVRRYQEAAVFPIYDPVGEIDRSR